ncbi:MAG: fasciclin domain-containing protein [Candidatus Krumholzibacteria bacterium]|nr:fasciclin domain-containing protein [Candidatus Krumholzibacteria bacterium]MDH4336754.1 fasciclin domain-containing protein [Candidatus Krumholzibacteria bacterium]MDH5270471.1 fasciclin domain-containing protein [Candidatus Krumholzibacteria bacterium]
MTIFDTAKAGGFSTLIAAVEAAGLQEALSGKDDLTVFAPTDEAFKKIPQEDLQALLADKEALKSVLLYHVVAGEVTSKDVMKLKSAKTLEGDEIKIDTTKGVKINNATVTKADVMASNGVIHVIDTVLIPPTK